MNQAIAADAGIARRILNHVNDRHIVPFSVRLPNGSAYSFGNDAPRFSVILKDRKALSAVMRFDELAFTEAYINGSLDIEGSMWDLMVCRELLSDMRPLHALWQRIAPYLAGQVRINRRAIAEHYEYDPDLYLGFMDRTRCYSQAVFEHDDEPLESAQYRKLETAVSSCGLKAGDRVLDVGGGWGSFVEYAGSKGIQVTALTIAPRQAEFINDLIERHNLPCRTILGDFYDYSTPEPYDAIVILGVMEHLPDYGAVIEQIHRLLKPGGKVYLDASSFREKYSKPTFISRYVFPGNHRFFCLHDFLEQVARTKLEVLSVHNDRHSYYLTCREWAINLDKARDEIVERWGERVYRIFALYLWGSAHAFYSRSMDAFRVVLERPAE